MAVKRSCSLKNKSHCVCLKCGAQILPDDLKDNTVYKCVRCGQEMTVDRYDSRAVLTVIEKPDLRRRIPPEIMTAAPQQKAEIMRLLQENDSLKDQLHKADGKINLHSTMYLFKLEMAGGLHEPLILFTFHHVSI